MGWAGQGHRDDHWDCLSVFKLQLLKMGLGRQVVMWPQVEINGSVLRAAPLSMALSVKPGSWSKALGLGRGLLWKQ